MHNNDIKFFHVLWNYQDDTWYLKVDDQRGSVIAGSNKVTCIERAIELAKHPSDKKRKVIIHGTSGRFQEVFDFE